MVRGIQPGEISAHFEPTTSTRSHYIIPQFLKDI